MNLTKVEKEALADLIRRNMLERERLAIELGTSTNIKFWEELLKKLNETK